MNYPTTRAVFDRKKIASKTKTGLVQIEILHEGKRKFISTGIKIYEGQWKTAKMVVGRTDAFELNERINLLLRNIREFINNLIKNKEYFTFDRLERFLETGTEQSDSFLDFIERRIEERQIQLSTKRQHRVMLSRLIEFGLIKTFEDLTPKNIKLLDDYERKFTSEQTTIYAFHKRVKTYVKEALQYELIKQNPYDQFKVPRGTHKPRKPLTKSEIKQIIECEVPNLSIDNARDCFLFCYYTGLAYVDLCKFDFEKNVIEIDGEYIINDKRVKTGTQYKITLLSPAMEILQKHNFKLPIISNQKYNLHLKTLTSCANLNTPLSSHIARHSFATWALSEGISIAIVSKMLGHTDIRTTQIYAKILQQDVTDSFHVLEKKLIKEKKKKKS